MRRLVALLFSAAVASADPVTDASERALEVFRAKGDLKDLASKDDPDPWLVADELCARGEHDAAEAFAEAAVRADTEKLPAYFASSLRREGRDAARDVFNWAVMALAGGDAGAALEALQGIAAPPEPDVLSVRVAHARAGALRALRRREEAVRAFAEAAEAAENLGWLARACACLDEAAKAADNRVALGLFERRLRLEERRGNQRGIASALGNLGVVHYHLGVLPEALELYQRTLRAMEELEDRRGVAITVMQIGAVHWQLGSYAKALEFHERAVTLLGELGAPEVAHAVTWVGSDHASLGDYAKALGFHERALTLWEKAGDRAGVAIALRSIGGVHWQLGSYAMALASLQRALSLEEALDDRSRLATTIALIGNVHWSLGRFASAIEFHERSLRLYEEQGDRAGVAKALLCLGVVHTSVGSHATALEYLDRALRLHEEIGDRAGAALTCMNAGIVQWSLGSYAKALALLERALSVQEELGDPVDAAATLGNIGLVHYRVGFHEEALRFMERALKVTQDLGDRAGAATSLGNIGLVHSCMGSYAKALEFQERALSLMEDLGDRAGMARTIGNIGALHQKLGSPGKALEFHERALALEEELGAGVPAAASLANIGLAHANLGAYGKALECYQRALVASRALQAADTHKLASSVGSLLLETGRAEESVRAFDEAMGLIEEQRALASGLGEAGQTSLFGELKGAGAFEGMCEALLALGRPEEALHSLERGRARTVLDVLERSRFDPLKEAERRARERDDKPAIERISTVAEALRDADARVASLGRSLDELQGKPQPDEADVERLTSDLTEGRSAQEKALRDRAALVADLVPVGAPASVQAIQRALGPRERLLFYSFSSRGALLFLVPAAGSAVRAFRLEGTQEATVAASIDALLAEVVVGGRRARGVDRPAGEINGATSDLFRALVPPEAWEEIRKCERVYVVPHGPLHRLPFELLATDGGARWLDAGPPVSYVPSGSVMLWCRKRRDEQRARATRYEVVALGDAVFRRGPRDPLDRFGPLPPLPGTRREVLAIEGVFAKGNVRVLAGEEATEARLYDLAPQARYVHLATHQLVDETNRLGNSRIALTVPEAARGEDDGFLGLRELFERWRDRLSGCELVVLSACETVKGPLQKDEGPYAMPLGFLYAGAPAVIGSLWRVDDTSTAELFADFYARIAKGKGKLEAFTEARKALKKKHPEPYFWAPFVYVGDPR